MSLDNIPTRANSTEIDLTWFNILQAVLGADLVPRNSGGVPTDQAGGLGTSSYAWVTAYLMTLKLRAATSGNIATLKAVDTLAASLQITLPAALPSSTARLTLDSTGQMGTLPGAIVVGSDVGTSLSINNASTMTDISSVTITTNGGPVMLWLQATGLLTTAATEIFLQNASGASVDSGFFQFSRDATIISIQDVVVPKSATMGMQPGAFLFVDPAPSAGSHTYKLSAQCDTTNLTIYMQHAALAAREI